MATPVHELDLPTLSLFDVDREEARRLLDEARARSWLVRAPMGYLVTRYEHVVGVLRERRFFQAARLLEQIQNVTDEEWLSRRRTSILTAEGDEHARLRRLVAPAFTPRAADRLRPYMREVMSGLVDPIAARGRSEFVADVCEPYPIPIICRLLGAPARDWKLFSGWASDIFRLFNADLNADLPVIKKAQAELEAYTLELIARRRDEPAEDLLTDLIAAEEAGDRLSTDELVMLTEAVILAGTDTTRNQLACAMALFAEHPAQWKLLAEQPELAARAVEEVMRVIGAVRGTMRFASEDVVYNDVLFPTGTLVMTSFIGANNDPGVWDGPDRFDITRESASPQLTFGSGIHYCLGAWLARAELAEGLALLARRLPGLALDGPVVWKPNTVGIWGPASLPLRFEAGH